MAAAPEDRRVTRGAVLAAAAAALLAIGVPPIALPAPLLLWNASASVPIGLYAVRPAGSLALGELVAVAPPPGLASFLAERGYLPLGVPLLKQIAALPGQIVCRVADTITENGDAIGAVLARDHLGRPLPDWHGCVSLVEGQVFLMNPAAPASLDGRYFGALPARTIIGRAVPLWTRGGP
jgi:conjugative transfer signal peptidase TraF